MMMMVIAMVSLDDDGADGNRFLSLCSNSSWGIHAGSNGWK
jgi:hypothetical protein